jgi:Concanavalin A-like lectin/glucanases superfamily
MIMSTIRNRLWHLPVVVILAMAVTPTRLKAADAFVDLGGALSGTGGGLAVLSGAGTLHANAPGAIMLSNALANNAFTYLFVSAVSMPAPFKGGILQAAPVFQTFPLMTGPTGSIVIPFTTPSNLPANGHFWLQVAQKDSGAIQGFSLSNALRGDIPPACGDLPSSADIIGWWKGDGTPFNSASSGAQHDGMWIGGSPTYGQGKVGLAFAFDGTPGHVVQVTDIAGFPAQASPRTIELWCQLMPKNDNLSLACGYGAVPQTSPDGQGFYVFPQHPLGSPVGRFAFTGSGTAYDLYSTALVTDAPTWHHLAVTYDGTMIRMYVDGVKIKGPAPLALTTTLGGWLTIGGHPLGVATGQESGCSGLIDEVTLWNRALSDSEIEAIFAAGGSGKCM